MAFRARGEADYGGPTGGARRRAIALIAVAASAAVAVALLSRSREAAVVGAPADGCNGDEALCGRPLDKVAFAATHNAMGAVDAPGWMFPQQERGLAGQLEDGVRALLIDIYSGVPVAGSVKTELRPDLMKPAERAVGKEGLDAAMRIRERLVGPPEGPPGLYLCHGFCEIGAQPLGPWLQVLHAFMVANPREVVIVVVEDYVPPAEIAAAFADAGLAQLAYRRAPGPPWPTLDEMGEAGERLVVFLESGTAGVDWLRPAFETIQETPYRFPRPADFTCAANRGGTDGSLFQINHWIETPPMPKPSNAAIVNARDVAAGRAPPLRRGAPPPPQHRRGRLLPDGRSLRRGSGAERPRGPQTGTAAVTPAPDCGYRPSSGFAFANRAANSARSASRLACWVTIASIVGSAARSA